MSLIHTCERNGVNAFDILNQLHLNVTAVTETPEHWMPWNDLTNGQSVSDVA